MLERFELVPDQQTPYLTFEGFFEKSSFSQIQILPGDKKTETSIILPNTFINNIFFANPEITSFKEDGILEKLSLEEKIKRKNTGEIDPLVILKISTIVNYKIEFDLINKQLIAKADKSTGGRVTTVFQPEILKQQIQEQESEKN